MRISRRVQRASPWYAFDSCTKPQRARSPDATAASIVAAKTVTGCLICCCLAVLVLWHAGARPAWGWGSPYAARAVEAMRRLDKGRTRPLVNTKNTLSLSHGLGSGAGAPRTLVLYVFSNTDPQYYSNLLYFISHGIPGCDSCDYYIVVNQGLGAKVLNFLTLSCGDMWHNQPAFGASKLLCC